MFKAPFFSFFFKSIYNEMDARPFNYHVVQKLSLPVVERKLLPSASLRKIANYDLEFEYRTVIQE